MSLKGVLLAGGSGSRLFPLTLVTNKHLLPVYDRPMIYYPLETLRELGCREVMVVVGGRSVGDILELLHDGSDVGLALTYRYQRGALGIAHAIGLARSPGMIRLPSCWATTSSTALCNRSPISS
jgi:glucose-1-phosphate thymidylyltransferase